MQKQEKQKAIYEYRIQFLAFPKNGQLCNPYYWAMETAKWLM